MKGLLFALISLASFSHLLAQPTIGLIQSTPTAFDGYTLFSPEKNENVYLINNCGEKVNTWIFSERPGLTCYLLEDGNLLRAGKDSLEIRDWDNNLIWSYSVAQLGNQHHDIEPLPNGNILLVMADNYSNAAIIAEGRDPSVTNTNFKLDRIIELEPTTPGNANVVWEWKFFDHLVQEFDNTRPNFGDVSTSPELLDLNYYDAESNQDYTHVNSIDYDADLDHILISARHLNEIYIIDHSTTTQEAAGHTGGNSGKGGDFLWRWGNPHVYQSGTPGDQKIGQQHDAKFIKSGPFQGMISCFSNEAFGFDPFSSSVHIIQPDETGGIYAMSGMSFLPFDNYWSWTGTLNGDPLFGDFKCGFQVLDDGHMIITETEKGKASEIDSTGNLHWQYIVPHGSSLMNQFDTPIENEIFRAERYAGSYVGLNGQDLSGNGIIENVNDSSAACVTLGVDEMSMSLKVYPNPTSNWIHIFSDYQIISIELLDMKGQLVSSSKEPEMDLSELSQGLYQIRINTEQGIIVKMLVKE